MNTQGNARHADQDTDRNGCIKEINTETSSNPETSQLTAKI
jgi:hypothetical protein